MAVDTAQKRFSLVGFGGPVPAMLFPPSGDIDAAARADALYLYAGFALGEPVAPEVPGNTGGWLSGGAGRRQKPKQPPVTFAERRGTLKTRPEPSEKPADAEKPARKTLTTKKAADAPLSRAETQALIGALERLQDAKTALGAAQAYEEKKRRQRMTLALLLMLSQM